eukprot:jgi/Botrbrau1/19737/Bobra.0502s0001.1
MGLSGSLILPTGSPSVIQLPARSYILRTALCPAGPSPGRITRTMCGQYMSCLRLSNLTALLFLWLTCLMALMTQTSPCHTDRSGRSGLKYISAWSRPGD